MSAPRRPVLAGNWKMNHGPSETARFFADFLAMHAPADDRTVVFFPPAISFAAAKEAIQGRPDVRLGVQNVYWEASGAFTGEVRSIYARSHHSYRFAPTSQGWFGSAQCIALRCGPGRVVRRLYMQEKLLHASQIADIASAGELYS